MSTPVWTWLPGAGVPVLAATLELGAGQGRLRYEAAYMEMAPPGALTWCWPMKCAAGSATGPPVGEKITR